jgi:predicted RNA binding protein YcfA (HicA-like mRNA interferase family)
VAQWGTHKARRVLAALKRLGWSEKRVRGSHRTLERKGWADVLFAYHDDVEIGPVAMKKLAERTGLAPDDM